MDSSLKQWCYCENTFHMPCVLCSVVVIERLSKLKKHYEAQNQKLFLYVEVSDLLTL